MLVLSDPVNGSHCPLETGRFLCLLALPCLNWQKPAELLTKARQLIPWDNLVDSVRGTVRCRLRLNLSMPLHHSSASTLGLFVSSKYFSRRVATGFVSLALSASPVFPLMVCVWGGGPSQDCVTQKCENCPASPQLTASPVTELRYVGQHLLANHLSSPTWSRREWIVLCDRCVCSTI